MTTTLPSRNSVASQHTWDLASIFASQVDWEASYQSLETDIPTLAHFQGRLGESPARLLQWLQTSERIEQAMGKVLVYAQLVFDEDTTNQQSVALMGRAQSLSTRLRAAMAFARSELLALDPAQIERFLAQEPALEIYRHFFDDMQRQRQYIRSAEVEDVLAQAEDPLSCPWNGYQVLSDADLTFASVQDSSGQQHHVARGTIEELLNSPDRTLRKAAWNAHADGFLSVKNTMAALIAGNVQASVFRARVRGYPGACEASLSASNIPLDVYNNVLDACNRHLPIWHRYWDIRRRALGLERLESCDIFAPLVEQQPDVSYAQAVEWICAGMQPLGEEYVSTARVGLLEERWVDIYPNRGKRSGAYSSGTYDTHPFILMNYSSGLESMSTLAHELGHSMHSHYTRIHQPYIYSDYTLFVAEVASNFNQALVRDYMLRQHPEREFQIAIIEEAMHNFHRYLFLMPILAQFELHIHRQVEQNQALTADEMTAYLARLFKRGYGDAMLLDESREGIAWAQFPHMYVNFYVYQYASGIAAANALADQVLAGDAEATMRYLQFLQAGNSLYPLDALKLAGIDMTSPALMDRAFKVLEGFVDRLDQLI